MPRFAGLPIEADTTDTVKPRFAGIPFAQEDGGELTDLGVTLPDRAPGKRTAEFRALPDEPSLTERISRVLNHRRLWSLVVVQQRLHNLSLAVVLVQGNATWKKSAPSRISWNAVWKTLLPGQSVPVPGYWVWHPDLAVSLLASGRVRWT